MLVRFILGLIVLVHANSMAAKFEYVENLIPNHYELFLLENQLNEHFSDYWGGTGSDPTNLTAFLLECSATKDLDLGSCVWSLAGSMTDLDKESGRMSVKRMSYDCRLPIKGKVKDLFDFLTAIKKAKDANEALDEVRIPGTSLATRDVLNECIFKNPKAKSVTENGRQFQSKTRTSRVR